MTLERSKPNSLKLSNLNLFKNNLTLLAGLWVPADSGATITVTNPANGEVVGQVPLMGSCGNRAGDYRFNLGTKIM
jgi:succinate-semialdehyde dehydrogenase/glutarate-semialdehyde dehydrogenase